MFRYASADLIRKKVWHCLAHRNQNGISLFGPHKHSRDSLDFLLRHLSVKTSMFTEQQKYREKTGREERTVLGVHQYYIMMSVM